MESLTRLVTDSLARHGFDRPVDPRRLQWSRWSRCDSPHSLLVVPSKPGIFAIAEEVAALGGASEPRSRNPERSEGTLSVNAHGGTATPGCPVEQHSAAASIATTAEGSTDREGHDFSRAVMPSGNMPALAAEVRRMLAVLQFSEDDDMAFTLDRMFTQANPMRARFAAGRCFLRFVVIEDQAQRRSICSALNQWLLTSAEKATGLPADFQSSLEFTDCESNARVGRTLMSDNADAITVPARGTQSVRDKDKDMEHPAPHLNSGASKNLHCPHPLPSGF